jgi:phosphopantothenoylcysteine decarboxylase/phosphopantothenate--cysteine ligase
MRILITAGPTREFFDSVRFISNPSSGRMGYAIAEAALARGHQVVLISGPVQIEAPPGVELVRVIEAEDMFAAATRAFDGCDAAIMTAAVCDYRPARRLPHKLKKQARTRRITLRPTPDICAHLGRLKGRRVVIGFAMEDHDERAHAEAKLVRKHCDAIVLNGIANVGSQDATVEIVTADGRWSDPIAGSKRQVAAHVVRLAERLVENSD